MVDRIRSLRRDGAFAWSLRVLPPRVARFQWRARALARQLDDQFSLSSATRPPKLALILEQARGCRRIVELGTGTAWTSISLLLADPRRTLLTYDPVDRHERARYIELAGPVIADRLRFVNAPGTAGPAPAGHAAFDLLFIDSSHTLAETVAEFERWRPALGDGALVIFDDYGHADYPEVRAAVEALGLAGHSDAGLFFHRLPPAGERPAAEGEAGRRATLGRMRAVARQALFLAARAVFRLPGFPGRNRAFTLLLRAAQRLGPPIVVDVDGLSMELDMRDGLCRGIWLDRGFAQGRAFEALCRPGDVVIDVGANVGHMALLAARKVGPGGRVLAIEPGARSHSLLASNAARNFPDRIETLRAACDEADGTATLYVSEYSEEFNSLRPDTVLGGVHQETVPARSLGSLCQERALAPDVVKIDVEGAEWAVLRGLLGGARTAPRALLVEAFEPNTRGFGYRPSQMCAWLIEHGYELSLSRETERFPYSDARADGPLLHDVIAVREDATER